MIERKSGQTFFRAARRNGSFWSRAAQDLAETPKAALLASLIINILALALPLTLLQIYDRVLPNGAVNTMLALLGGLLAVVVIDAALKIVQDLLITRAALPQAFQRRVGAFARLAHSDDAGGRGKASRFWLERMLAMEEAASIESARKPLLMDLPFAAIFLAMIGLVGGWLVAVPLVCIALLAGLMLRTARRQDSLTEGRREQDDARYARLSEWLAGIGTVKLLAMEMQLYRRYEKMLTEAAGPAYRAVLYNNRLPILGQSFSNLMMIGVTTAGAVHVIDGAMSIGSLACCSLLATRVAQPIFRVAVMTAQHRALALTEVRADEVMALPPAPCKAAQSFPLNGSVRLLGVFVAPRPGSAGLSAIELIAEPGETIGVIGAADSGRAELLAVIGGSLAPLEGRATVDGRDASSPEMRRARRQMQRLDGRVAIFRGSILDNITMFRASEIAAALQAAEMAGLSAPVSKLADGYDTRIGDGAAMVLPHGLEQALMLARALAQRPAILLVEGIGERLDFEVYRRLERAFQQMPARPTVFLTSERLHMLSGADRIYELRGGRLQLLGEAEPIESQGETVRLAAAGSSVSLPGAR